MSNNSGRSIVWTVDLENIPDIVIDSRASVHIVMDPGYWSDVTEIARVDAHLANETTVTATIIGIAKIAVRRKWYWNARHVAYQKLN